MAVLSWCSDFLVNSVWARDLSLLTSVKYDFYLVISWSFVCEKYPCSAPWQVNSFVNFCELFNLCSYSFLLLKKFTYAVLVFIFRILWKGTSRRSTQGVHKLFAPNSVWVFVYGCF